MHHRSFPKLPGLDVSILGFGAMRLPVLGGDHSRIDEEAATKLVHDSIRGGVNYVDTAWVYHGGESEAFLGRALRGGWREKVQLATKCPVWDMNAEADFERVLDQQLAKLQTKRIDFYLLHSIAAGSWEKVKAIGGLRALERARKDGRIGHLGFSFHGPCDDFKKIIDEHDGWEFAQIQLNYLDQGYQAGLEGLRYAAARKVGVIVMEPLRGGALANAPEPVRQALSRSGRAWAPAEWALRWVWHQPEVVTVLSGMGRPEQVSENLRSAAAAAPLTSEDLGRIAEARAFYEERMAVPCTTCGYCQPCPNGVAIADVFSDWNAATMLRDGQGQWAYKTFRLGNGVGADKCEECGDCETRCPQHIAIPEKLQVAHDFLTR